MKKATPATTRKRAGPKTTAPDLPTPTQWYIVGADGVPPPQPGYLYLFITVDIDGDTFLQVGMWSKDLGVWVNTDCVAVEMSETVIAYSLVFDTRGLPWVVE